MKLLFRLSVFFFFSYSLKASPIEVVKVEAQKNSKGTWNFHVTLKHKDTGWEHYADGWRVEDKGGNILGTRILGHPHVETQPFTRSLYNVKIKESVKEILIRASDLISGWEKKTYKVKL